MYNKYIPIRFQYCASELMREILHLSGHNDIRTQIECGGTLLSGSYFQLCGAVDSIRDIDNDSISDLTPSQLSNISPVLYLVFGISS